MHPRSIAETVWHRYSAAMDLNEKRKQREQKQLYDSLKKVQRGNYATRPLLNAVSWLGWERQELPTGKVQLRAPNGATIEYDSFRLSKYEEAVGAWFRNETTAIAQVDEFIANYEQAQRPPEITSKGLSPKVTKTLFEMDLDIDLSTVKVPPIRKVGEKPKLNAQGEPIMRFGEPVMEDIHKVIWPTNTKFGMSRFSNGGGCEACGKQIPSGWFVPIVAECKKVGLVGLFIGRDCAGRIFRIKNEGIDVRTVQP